MKPRRAIVTFIEASEIGGKVSDRVGIGLRLLPEEPETETAEMQGQFTKEEAQENIESLDLIMKAMPNGKLANFIGEFNDLFLFLNAAKNAAPSEADAALAKSSKPTTAQDYADELQARANV